MKRMHRILLICVLAIAATACSTGVRELQHYYVLDPASDSPSPASHIAMSARSTLLVTPTTTAGFYDAQAIVYSPAVDTRAYYQLNSWTEPPSRRLVALLTERLRRSGNFRAVVTAIGGPRDTLVLDTQLDEFYYDAAAEPGSAKILLTATLSDPARRSVAGQRHFAANAAAPTPNPAGAVQAFDTALGSLLDEVVVWVAETAAQSRALP